MRFRLAGAYDEKEDPDGKIIENYRSYRTVAEFLEAELKTKNSGHWFYAHAGGLADIQWILEVLVEDPRYQIVGSFSGSSAVRVKVKRGQNNWTFVDSYFTLQASLKKIGDLLGFPKGEVPWDCALHELIEYNERDCRILYKALRQFEEIVIELGSEMNQTMASTAMRMVRRAYLKQDLTTSTMINKKVRPAYVGGRVEVFYRKRHSGFYYDINSCYPFAMTKPLPGRFLKTIRRLPETDQVAYIADVLIDVPEHMAVPPLPYVAEGSLFFPTGRRRSWLCRPEIELALKYGAKVEKVYSCLVFDLWHDLGDFATDLYYKRKNSKGYYKTVYKLLLNAAYGKFGERDEKSELLIHPTGAQYEEVLDMVRKGQAKHFQKGFLHMITPGVFLVERIKEVLHAHVPVAAYVTSLARVDLFEHFMKSKEIPYYCDTDGFALGDAHVPCGTELGELKLEKVYKNSLFYAPKLYHLEMASGEHIVKAKGFRNYRDPCEDCEGSGMTLEAEGALFCKTCRGAGFLEHRIDVKAFERLLEGKAVITNRMLRVREMYAKGLIHPKEEPMEKRLQNVTRTKRKFFEDGTSRPWDCRELDQDATVPRYGERAGEIIRIG